MVQTGLSEAWKFASLKYCNTIRIGPCEVLLSIKTVTKLEQNYHHLHVYILMIKNTHFHALLLTKLVRRNVTQNMYVSNKGNEPVTYCSIQMQLFRERLFCLKHIKLYATTLQVSVDGSTSHSCYTCLKLYTIKQ